MNLETDYLIIGSGAMGMAFADVMLAESDAEMIIVDRYHQPGGHWNVAYPFVTLHQPSAFYGVNSLELSKGRIDQIGLNKGLADLASGAEVSAYFQEVMQQKLLPTGRVQYFAMCDYRGEGKFDSRLTGKHYEVRVRKKIVDCTYLKTSVPATHTPNYSVDEAAQLIPINDLVKITEPPTGFVIIGGGKTGIDACLWLIEQQVDPANITWIVSRDAWMTDRKTTQTDESFFVDTIGNQAAQFEAIAQASSLEDLFIRLEEAGVFVRLDPSVKPEMFHGATVSQMELAQLRRIENVVRMGRVQHVGANEIVLDKGKIPTDLGKVYVDCSASAVGNLASKPVFEEKLITPQTIRAYQPVFSAAVIAYVEAHYETDKQKNNLCQVVPLPDHYTDWVPMMAIGMQNQYNWNQDKVLRKWLFKSRLNGFGKLIASARPEEEQKIAILKRLRNSILPAAMNLQKLVMEIPDLKR